MITMLPQKNFSVDPGLRDQVIQDLKNIKINDQNLNWSESSAGSFSIDLGQVNLHEVGERIVSYYGEMHDVAEFGLEFVQPEDRSNSSAYHIPEGILFIYDPKLKPNGSAQQRTEISALSVAPMILKHFDVPVPNYMTDKMAYDLVSP